MALLKVSTAYTRLFKMISSSDHLSLKTGAAPVVNLSKAGAAFGAAGGAVTEIANGWYKVALNTTDTNTLGDLAYYITGTGADDTDFLDQVSAQITSDLMATYTQPTGFLSATFPSGTVANTTNITAGTITTTTNLTNLPSIPTNWLTAAGIAASALNGKGDWLLSASYTAPTNLTAAQIATGVWTDTTAGDFTTALSIGKSVMNGVSLGTGLTINGYTGNTPQTGDAYARLGAPAGASTSADIAAAKVDTAAIKVQTDKLAFTVTNQVDANILSLSGDGTAATNLAKADRAVCRGTCGAGGTTTSIVTSAFAPGVGASGQFIGRTILFDATTATTALQGQASNITASTNSATPTLTVTALTTAPSSGDTFSIV